MAIEGPLRELAIPDVLQLLHLSRKTGTLTVRSDASERPAVLHLDRGMVVGARPPGDSSRLGRLLLVAGKVTVAQLERALAEQRRAAGRRLGAVLVETQGVPRAEVERQLRFQVEETVFELVRWEEGFFRFDETSPFAAGPVSIELSSESLLMEALRRVDEWSVLAAGRPDTSLVPRLVEQGEGSGGALLTLHPSEWEVLAGVDGERTLRSIAQEIGRAEFDVAKAVYGLVSAGVIELGSRPARVGGPPRRNAPAELLEAERALAERRPDEAERLLDLLDAREPGWATTELLRGRVSRSRGRWAEAARALEDALRRDPLLADAYRELGLVSIRTGDLSRAEECLRTYARLAEAGEPRTLADRAAVLVSELRRITEETP